MIASADTLLGQTIAGYRLVRMLGQGGMGTVFLGQRLDDTRALVAIKVLRLPEVMVPDDRAILQTRFLREARAASSLRHAHILPVLSYGEVGGLMYMVMPFIAGGTLGARLARQPGLLPLTEIAGYVSQLASALDYAHQHGVVHRDVKPSNVLLDEQGGIYLTDFGIARLFDNGPDGLTLWRGYGPTTLTNAGQIPGTPHYMAPEQINGEPAGPATDIYALGVVLYQLVTGQLPFDGGTPLAIAMKQLQEEPRPPRTLRPELPALAEAAILGALAKEPVARFATAGALAHAFVASLSNERTAALVPGAMTLTRGNASPMPSSPDAPRRSPAPVPGLARMRRRLRAAKNADPGPEGPGHGAMVIPHTSGSRHGTSWRRALIIAPALLAALALGILGLLDATHPTATSHFVPHTQHPAATSTAPASPSPTPASHLQSAAPPAAVPASRPAPVTTVHYVPTPAPAHSQEYDGHGHDGGPGGAGHHGGSGHGKH
jgi:serine/threonine protein kinase